MLFLSLVIIFIALAFYYLKYTFSYWERARIPQDVNNKIPFGCLTSLAQLKSSPGMCINDVYMKNKYPFVGIYLIFRPILLIRDIELVRNILVNNFNHFHDRGVYDGSASDILSSNLFSQTGQKWRTMRQKILPSFTAGKLKAMFGQSVAVADKMVSHLNSVLPDTGYKQINIKTITSTYAIDLVGSTIFGLEINSFKNPRNDFKLIIDEIHEGSIKNIILSALFLWPSLFKIFKQLGIENTGVYKLRDIVKKTIENREKNNIVRKDILQLLMQLRSQGEINVDDNNWAIENKSTIDSSDNFNLDNITAQCFIFYIAGQDTTAVTSAFTIFELAQNPLVLNKVQQEVLEVIERNDGQITYEALQQMEYLELCMQETLRKYPGLPILNRECTQDFNIPGTDTIIKKGTPIVIPIFGIQRDEEHFHDPEEYMPERFAESSRNYNPEAYMPFGDGPRICIAKRMGQMNAKLAVAKILHGFNIEIMEKKKIEIEPHSITFLPKGGLQVQLSKRNHK